MVERSRNKELPRDPTRTIMTNRFQQPVDAIKIVKRAPVRLTADALTEGKKRVAAGEDPERVARELVLRTLGGPGSGNFGHAGRPGEVGGSASSGPEIHGEGVEQFLHSLSQIPDALYQSVAKEIAIVKDSEAASKIDDYLLKHYGFDVRGQVISMVDRNRGQVITTQGHAPAAVARTLESRFSDKAWAGATKETSAIQREEKFVDAFTWLFSEKGPMFPIATMGNPISFAMEQVFHSWGWK